MKKFFKQPLNLVIITTSLIVTAYFGIKIYKEFAPKTPKTIEERKMECLRLGSDYRAKSCLNLLK